MSLEQCLEYIIPFLKVVAKKKYTKILLIDNILITLDEESSKLQYIILQQSTGQTIASTIENINDYMCEPISHRNYELVNDYLIYYQLLDLYNSYTSLNNSVFKLENCSTEDDIASLVTMRSKDGCKGYNLENKILLPFFYGLLPLTKLDTLDIEVFSLDDISVASKYVIRKKKLKCDIVIFTRLLLV